MFIVAVTWYLVMTFVLQMWSSINEHIPTIRLHQSTRLQLVPRRRAWLSRQPVVYFRSLRWRSVASWAATTRTTCRVPAKTRLRRVSATPPWRWWTVFRWMMPPSTWRRAICHRQCPTDRHSSRGWCHAAGDGEADLCRVHRRCRATTVCGAVTAAPTIATPRRVSIVLSVWMWGVFAAAVIAGQTLWRDASRTVRCCLTARCRSSFTMTLRRLRRHSMRRCCCHPWAATQVATTAPTSPSTASSCTPSSGTSDSSRCFAAGKHGKRPLTRHCYRRVCATPYPTSCSLPNCAACGRVPCLNRLQVRDIGQRHRRTTDNRPVYSCF